MYVIFGEGIYNRPLYRTDRIKLLCSYPVGGVLRIFPDFMTKYTPHTIAQVKSSRASLGEINR